MKTAKSMSIGAGWIVRRSPRLITLWIVAILTAGMLGRWWVAGALIAAVLIPGLAGSFAGRRWPGPWFRWIRHPRMRRQWKRRARRGWQNIADTCGLSQTQRGTKRVKDANGKRRKVPTTTIKRPKIKRPKAKGNALTLTIQPRRGQVTADVIAKAEHIASSLGGVEWSTSTPNLRKVTLEICMRDELHRTVCARLPGALDPKNVGLVDIGRRQDGRRWLLQIRGEHNLVIGVTGAGKNSVLGAILIQLAAGVPGGYVRLLGVDFGGGVEFAPLANIFSGLARNIEDGVQLLRDLKVIMLARQAEMIAAGGRLHVPTPTSPLIVLAIDELAAALYDSTPAGKRLASEFNGILGLLLTQGRKLGISVLAAQQDPHKDLLALRDRFTVTVLLRTANAEESAIAIGRSRKIPAHNIDPTKPGTAYVIQPDQGTAKVRADYPTDELLAIVNRTLRAPSASRLTIVAPAPVPVETRRRGPDKKPRAPRKTGAVAE